MDLFSLGITLIADIFGGQTIHQMADKGTQLKDNQKTETDSPDGKHKSKSGSDSSKAAKDDKKSPSKAENDKKKGEEHSSKDKKANPEAHDKKGSTGKGITGEALLKTTPYDPRFPNQNQTRNCYQNYLDYHRCLKVKNSESYCHYYQWAYRELCPKAWIEKWDDQRERGIFAGRI